MSQNVSIGGAARSDGVKVPTIRYYEQMGFFPARPARKATGAPLTRPSCDGWPLSATP